MSLVFHRRCEADRATSSLSTDDIPAKLRCAICGKLAVNAFRLPCCEQAICEACASALSSIRDSATSLTDCLGHSKLPSSCPICEHSPLSGEDCTPHKSLRTTVRVFLRTEEKKREASRPKDVTPATPVEPTATPQLPTPEISTPSAGAAATSAEQHEGHTSRTEQADIALPSTEEQGNQQLDSGAEPAASAETVCHSSSIWPVIPY